MEKCPGMLRFSGCNILEPRPIDLGAITVTEDGVHSEIYGSLRFKTPISELAIDRVTAGEAAAFKRFLDHYQQSWRDYFDPIAIHLGSTASGGIAADLSVLPLILSSDYHRLVKLTGTTTLGADIADPHQALLQIALALDHTSQMSAESERGFGAMAGGLASPLSWVGSGSSIYADPDPVWDAVSQSMPIEDRMKWLQQNVSRIPVGLNIAVKDQLKLAAFLASLKVLAAQSAPGMLVWDSRTWKGVTYVVTSPSAAGRKEIPTDLFYLPVAED